VIGMGTGGTISGTGRYLKEQNPNIKVIGVDPEGSILAAAWRLGHVPPDAQPRTYKVEGIGEDFLPSTLDLSVIDEVIQVGDKESFAWARRLVREEGIFSGGSAGSALAAAVQVGANLSDQHLLVVLLPDSGSRYLSKFYDDKWMRENGFLAADWCEASLKDILSAKPIQQLVTALEDQPLADVISAMKVNGISKMPVVRCDQSLAGLVTEIDLLKFLVDDHHQQSGEVKISAIMHPPENVYPANTPVERNLPAIMANQVVLVTEDNKPVGILTKADILDFITQGM
jgi:cystathionine beta-synthase